MGSFLRPLTALNSHESGGLRLFLIIAIALVFGSDFFEELILFFTRFMAVQTLPSQFGFLLICL